MFLQPHTLFNEIVPRRALRREIFELQAQEKPLYKSWLYLDLIVEHLRDC
jgi:hypothetical protein